MTDRFANQIPRRPGRRQAEYFAKPLTLQENSAEWYRPSRRARNGWFITMALVDPADLFQESVP
jgi:hypothetical protein